MLFELLTCIMTDRQERFDLNISKLKLLWKQRHLTLHLGCPWGKLKHTKINFEVNYRLPLISKKIKKAPNLKRLCLKRFCKGSSLNHITHQ